MLIPGVRKYLLGQRTLVRDRKVIGTAVVHVRGETVLL